MMHDEACHTGMDEVGGPVGPWPYCVSDYSRARICFGPTASRT